MSLAAPAQFLRIVFCPAALLLSFTTVVLAQPAAPAVVASEKTDAAPSSAVTALASQQLTRSVTKGVEYLVSSQADDGSWSAEYGPGVTSLITASLLANDLPRDHPTVAKALKYIEKHIRPDGGIHAVGSRFRNYETCLAILCLTKANKDKRYTPALAKAEKFIKGIQWDATEGYDIANPGYGGAGYGKHKRPDLSNTAFLVEALYALGNDSNDPSMQQALAFVSRCQNLDTPHNKTVHADKVKDGGFYYTAAAGGSSQAGNTPNGGLRSYGSMTYAGLKSMIYAGVRPDDKRVKAAIAWAKQHYSLTENPGMGKAGHYYYLHTIAKALHALGEKTLVDDNNVAHFWQNEIVAALSAMQQDDGSWANDNERWLESDTNLATGYALLTLSYCRK